MWDQNNNFHLISLSILITFLQGNVIMDIMGRSYIIINHFWEFKGLPAPPPPPHDVDTLPVNSLIPIFTPLFIEN